MRRIFLFAIFIYSFCFILQKNVMAQQLIPITGVNCGVAYNPDDSAGISSYRGGSPSATLNLLANGLALGQSKYACCEPYVKEKLLKETMSQNLRVAGETGAAAAGPLGALTYLFSSTIGSAADKLGSVLIDGFLTLPNMFGFNPLGAVLRVPTAGSVLQAYEGMNKCQNGAVDVTGPGGQCYCKPGEDTALVSLASFCGNIINKSERNECLECLGIDSKGNVNYVTNSFPKNEKKAGVWTSLGCVQSDLSSFIQNTVLTLGISLVGLVSLFCIIYASFLLQTSGGDPEKIKKAQELLTSCITGLMMVIFSVFILRLIGVTILQIPGFTQ